VALQYKGVDILLLCTPWGVSGAASASALTLKHALMIRPPSSTGMKPMGEIYSVTVQGGVLISYFFLFSFCRCGCAPDPQGAIQAEQR
jgi:hypothetical protein